MSGNAARQPPRAERLLGGTQRRPPSSAALGRRRWIVAFAKRALPVLALALLGLIALWPELVNQADQARLIYLRGSLMPESGMLTSPRYRGEDDNRQPYTLTADIARQKGPDRLDLTAPIGDIALAGGSWVQVQAHTGIYMQKSAQLDLSGEVTLYRDDGMVLTTDTATVDLREGVAASAAKTHAEGPFGTLDAQGFILTDRGGLVQFTGPARLVLNGARP